MVEKKNTIKASIVAMLVTSLMFIGGITVLDDNVYYCDARDMVMQCDKITKYYGLENGKCWNSEHGNKLCRSGWLEITKDTYIEPIKHKQETCDITKCTPI